MGDRHNRGPFMQAGIQTGTWDGAAPKHTQIGNDVPVRLAKAIVSHMSGLLAADHGACRTVRAETCMEDDSLEDTDSPPYCFVQERLMVLEEMSGVSGLCTAIALPRLPFVDDGECRRANTHWARYRNSEADGGLPDGPGGGLPAPYRFQWCDTHGLLGEDADAVVVDGKLIAERVE